MHDDWDDALNKVESTYGEVLVKKISELIDNNLIPEVNFMLKVLNC